ncbi:MAG: DUF5678 domain-containing protein [Chloroflexota bacterium]
MSWVEDEYETALNPEDVEDERIMAQEMEAYRQMHPELLKKYPHQYVVIHQGELVDRDTDYSVLIERVYENYSETRVILVRQVLPEIIPTLRMPSSMIRLLDNLK